MGVLMMKLVNYDERTLILQNLRPVTRQVNNTYTKVHIQEAMVSEINTADSILLAVY